MEPSTKMRIAALADLHHGRSDVNLKELFQAVTAQADILLLCGDITDHGLPDEAKSLAEEINRHLHVPALAVMGNHDYHSDQSELVDEILGSAGVNVLNGDSVEIGGVGFAGACGFAGGFDRWTLHPWGERAIRAFVQAAIDEVLKLEMALSRLDTTSRVVLLHYAPIRETVVGEPLEIFPFLGSSRLEDPLNHFKVSVAFHGHAHKGTHAGQTSTGVPVFNVSMPVLRATFPKRLPFHVIEVERDT
ncbi:MAG: metallophosphoesterase [Bradymonadaceae bacterium]|nr:metallophosphoesterase [Lujinxingiaceae bacterium]